MFTTNPFAALSQSIPPAAIQTYVAVMIVLVAAGTLFGGSAALLGLL